MEELIISPEIERNYGLIGDWCEGSDSDFNFCEPHGFWISRYSDAPIKDYEKINKISEYLINKKNLDQKDDIIIYWKANVSPVPAEGTRKRIFGISYWFEDGIYYIARIENRQSNIKFLYAFSTEIPADPHAMPIGVCRTMKKIAEEVGLKYSRRTSYLTPVFYILEDTVSFENYLTLESKVKELKKNLDLPLFNSKNDLKIVYGSGWHRIGR